MDKLILFHPECPICNASCRNSIMTPTVFRCYLSANGNKCKIKTSFFYSSKITLFKLFAIINKRRQNVVAVITAIEFDISMTTIYNRNLKIII